MCLLVCLFVAVGGGGVCVCSVYGACVRACVCVRVCACWCVCVCVCVWGEFLCISYFIMTA